MALTNEQIESLEKKGFRRWQKGSLDRLYINAAQLGLECTYYHTGNISGAEFCGVSISNCEARRMKAAKSYINVTTGEAHSDNGELLDAIERILAEI